MTGPFQFTRFPSRLAAALRGVQHLLRTSADARIHLLAAIVVASLGLWLKLSRNDWSWIIAAVGLVWCAKGLNSAIETLANRVSREHDALIGQAKDLAAGAVL